MRKRLKTALMLTRTTAIATSLAFFPLVNGAPRVWAEDGENSTHGITATQEHGRMIYVNEDGPAKERATPAPVPQTRTSHYVYWSSKENRWKPVPSAGTESMKAARSAAAEVSQFYGRDSARAANAKIMAANSRGHQASADEIDVSPDERWLLYSSIDSGGESSGELMLIENVH